MANYKERQMRSAFYSVVCRVPKVVWQRVSSRSSNQQQKKTPRPNILRRWRGTNRWA